MCAVEPPPEVTVPLTAVEHVVLTDILHVVPHVARRMRAALGDRFDPALHAPSIAPDINAPLVVPRSALATTTAVLIEADARWYVGRIHELVFGIVAAIDKAAALAGWV